MRLSLIKNIYGLEEFHNSQIKKGEITAKEIFKVLSLSYVGITGLS